MAFNGGTTIADVDKLKISTFYGGATTLQAALKGALDDGDIIISANLSGRKLIVVWYDISA